MNTTGRVYLVGAGPGDPGLLTLRASELLARADVVIYDALVNPALLCMAPAKAEVIYGGKRCKEQALTQEEINRLLIEKARAGKLVVRLKGGDPYVFGRGAEEAEQLHDAGIPFEVVPGVSSALAVPNYAGIPLTHRDMASAFTVLTGHEDPNQEESDIDWAQVAAAPGTKVVLMGLRRIGAIAAALIGNGMPPSTPVAMIRWGTLGRQESIEGTLETIAAEAERSGFGAPTVTVIGEVVQLRSKLNWFERRPLFGQRVVVTRSRGQAGQLTRLLTDRGAEVLEVPTIRIEGPGERQPLVEALAGLGAYDWLIFTSANGVTAFFDLFFKAFPDLRDLGAVRIAAVGPATAARLRELHLQVDCVPEQYVGARIADALGKMESLENLRMLLLRAEVANREVVQLLEDKGAIVDDIACYRTVPEPEDPGGAAARLAEEGADWITFTSASTVENLNARFELPALLRRHGRLKSASIGPETSKALAALGVRPTVEADPHTLEGLIAAMESGTKPRGRG